MRKRGTTALLVLALGVAMAAPAWADCQNKIALNVTPAGATIDASGTAEVRGEGAKQRFKVSMDARVADGTTFEVFANGQLAGTITIALGAGELDLNNNNGAVLPTGDDPVCSVSTVDVLAAGAAILQGTF